MKGYLANRYANILIIETTLRIPEGPEGLQKTKPFGLPKKRVSQLYDKSA